MERIYRFFENILENSIKFQKFPECSRTFYGRNSKFLERSIPTTARLSVGYISGRTVRSASVSIQKRNSQQLKNKQGNDKNSKIKVGKEFQIKFSSIFKVFSEFFWGKLGSFLRVVFCDYSTCSKVSDPTLTQTETRAR